MKEPREELWMKFMRWMEELSDNCRHGKMQEMVIVLGDTLEEF
jgi:hypothetical protein